MSKCSTQRPVSGSMCSDVDGGAARCAAAGGATPPGAAATATPSACCCCCCAATAGCGPPYWRARKASSCCRASAMLAHCCPARHPPPPPLVASDSGGKARLTKASPCASEGEKPTGGRKGGRARRFEKLGARALTLAACGTQGTVPTVQRHEIDYRIALLPSGRVAASEAAAPRMPLRRTALDTHKHVPVWLRQPLCCSFEAFHNRPHSLPQPQCAATEGLTTSAAAAASSSQA